MSIELAGHAHTAPRMDIDLFTPEVLTDPWPIYDQIRRAGPVVWNGHGSFWMTARDEVCRRMLGQPTVFGDALAARFFGDGAIIAIDDKAEHSRLRNIWIGAFSHRAVASLAAMVRELADTMIDAILPRWEQGEAIDIMEALCRPLPAHVIARMLGLHGEAAQRVVVWSDRMSNAMSGGYPIDYDNDPAWLASEHAKAELAAFLREQIADRRDSPGDDLISRIVHAPGADLISDEVKMVNIRVLLFGGNETTAKWLGHVVNTFAERPDVRQAVEADRSRLPRAVEEILRYNSVVHVFSRQVTCDGIEIDGIGLPKDSDIRLLPAAANRDPERWTAPDRMDIDREPQPHLAFGYGMHGCIGAMLARMEVAEVIGRMLDRLGPFRVVAPVAYGNLLLRGPTALWIARA